MSGVFLDIDTRKSAEEALARSNADLERFAYVASHDLQEPLRMVASFVQLLGDRYKGKLDDTADEFIGFAVDGASRMQRMLEDLLAFSRLSRSQEPPVPTSAADALAAALRNLSARTEESHAVIEARSLPVVLADPSQLERVFTNLLGNALKFRNGSDPVVHVAADREGPLWHFRVRDNGIGIDPRYFERVFMLFQRLHTREHYEGNGMGLAITKRIIERWGGRIWVESEPNTGSTFHFTLHAPPGAPA
jgi:light-regulated signal transduction histidine kinase (bacteriophytochrome)